MVLGLLATACPLFRIGLSDSGDALTYGGRIAGFTVLVAAVVELIAAAAAVDYWRKRRWSYSGVAVLAGVVLALLCSISFLFLQVGECFTGYTLVGIVLAIWSSVALFRLIRCRAWQGLHVPRKIAIGVIVSTLLAGTNLAYTQLYVPYVLPPVIQSGAEFRESILANGGAQMYVTVHLYVKNAGQVPVYILDSIYWIHGGPASSVSDAKAARDDLIYDGAFVTPVGRVLNPGEEVAQDAVVEINNPQKRAYEAVKAQTDVYVIRKDRMTMPSDYERSRVGAARLKREASGGDPPNAEYRYRSAISNSSEILNLTRRRQRISVWRVDNGEWPAIVVDVSPPGDRIAFDPIRPLKNQKIIDRYGLTRVRGSTAQMPYPELLQKARSG
ncbi:hypothetical protein [Streptomyces sp. A1136]|uniref:hypothetical protein n=2 Tax=unclassified Streptomyces TaxID=2593676 RepID=UPI00109E597B|nr:hypothetical protein [Streptomyces sp. A1136]THA44959.1 hypothetical protein E6R62_36140 [Streptomyces sp. A1136]